MLRFVEVFDIKLNCELLVNIDSIAYVFKRRKESGGETLVHIDDDKYFTLGPEAYRVLRDLLSVDGPDPVRGLVDGICARK